MPAASALLAASGLPTAGFDALTGSTLIARDEAGIAGVVSLEPHGRHALLRSLAVAGSHRGEGVGVELTEAAVALARARGIGGLYLLTETAERFFPRFGFREIGREDVPAEVRRSVEFTSACPASAIAMELSLS